MQKTSTVTVGKIMSTHGLDGWLSIESYTLPVNYIKNYNVFIYHTGEKTSINILDLKVMPKKIIIKLENYDSIDDVEKFIGLNIYMHENELIKLKSNEYYWRDLEGLKVYDSSKIYIGVVDFIFNNGANDVLVIKDHENVKYVAYIKSNFIEISKTSIMLSDDAF